MKGDWLWCCLWVCCCIACVVIEGATDSIDAQVRTEMAKALKAGSITDAIPQIGKSSDPGSSSTGTPAGSSSGTGKPKSTNNSWIIILIFLGMLLVVSWLIYQCCVDDPHCPDASPSPDLEQHNGGPRDGSLIKPPRSTMITIQELREGTDNFSKKNKLGQGGFGVVYKGKLPNGTKIAVKRMNAEKVGSKGPGEFEAEINVLTQVRHRNLVNLLGYCIEGEEKMLVYEYIPQGPLSQHLFEREKAKLKPLDWKQRLSIALDVAHGVQYLHNLALESVIHRDLKPSNILLGDGMQAKVSDFGLVKLARDGIFSVELNRIKGTFGYIAPDYAEGELTTKLDVFSFGVVLMELITGRRALDETQPKKLQCLAIWFRPVIKSGVSGESFRNAVDPVLYMADDTFQSICKVAELAMHCTAQHSSDRPDMGYVVNVLSGLVHPWKPPVSDEQSLGALKRLWQTVKGGASSSEARTTQSASWARLIQTVQRTECRR